MGAYSGAKRQKHEAYLYSLSQKRTPILVRPTAQDFYQSRPRVKATCTWRRLANVWACTYASPECNFLRALNRDQAKLMLLQKGAHWQEIPDPSLSSQPRSHPQNTPTHNLAANKAVTAAPEAHAIARLDPSSEGSPGAYAVRTGGQQANSNGLILPEKASNTSNSVGSCPLAGTPNSGGSEEAHKPSTAP